MRALLVFSVLLLIKVLGKMFYRFDSSWVGDPVNQPWSDIRLVAFLHHTSLYEPIFLGAVPNSIIWRLARQGVVPGADKTLARPWVGLIFRAVAHRVVSISRQRDHTWDEFMSAINAGAMVVMAPEGRMMRPSGLDLNGKPMTVRGGIADILEAIETGRMLVAYSGGLHHVQAPGERFPRLFRTVRIRFEILDIERYCSDLGGTGQGSKAFRASVIKDLEARRSRHCPISPS